jgi:hypothetical protein
MLKIDVHRATPHGDAETTTRSCADWTATGFSPTVKARLAIECAGIYAGVCGSHGTVIVGGKGVHLENGTHLLIVVQPPDLRRTFANRILLPLAKLRAVPTKIHG